MKRLYLGIIVFAVTVAATTAVSGQELYRVLTLRAAPGEFSAWLAQWPDLREAYVERGDEAPLVLRHSQGDQWDFMMIEPWGSFEAYLDPKKRARRKAAPEAMALLVQWLDKAPAFREDLFALGPPLKELKKQVAENSLYHVEMFYALPYQKDALLEQRRMENDYLERTGQTTNTVWIGVGGSDVDVFTIGFHDDLAAFAAGSTMDEKARDAEAKKAGFEGLSHIAPYLRSLIAAHHDTLAVPVK